MKLRIETIADRGIPYQERLHLKVLETTSLSSHIVVSSSFVSLTSVANGPKSCFWFPPQTVKPNDDIVLYTRGGAPEVPRVGLSGSTTYFYFWGLLNTLWDDPKSCALVFDVSGWAASMNPDTEQYLQQFNLGFQSTVSDIIKAGAGANSIAELMRLRENTSASDMLKQWNLQSLTEEARKAGAASSTNALNDSSSLNTLGKEVIKRDRLTPPDDDDPSNKFF